MMRVQTVRIHKTKYTVIVVSTVVLSLSSLIAILFSGMIDTHQTHYAALAVSAFAHHYL